MVQDGKGVEGARGRGRQRELLGGGGPSSQDHVRSDVYSGEVL